MQPPADVIGARGPVLPEGPAEIHVIGVFGDPPVTVEGWYALHQIFEVDRAAWRALAQDARDHVTAQLTALAAPTAGGWSAAASLIGSCADLMLIHFRPTLEDLAATEQTVRGSPYGAPLRLTYSLLGVAEAALYHVSARLARDAAARDGAVGDDEYAAALRDAIDTERMGDHVRRRLYPMPPPSMPYVCFYPMSKGQRRGGNWYALPLDARGHLMHAHGLTGRRYAGRVVQVISGAVGLDTWEWGVTLFAADPLVFKKLLADMRFDEVTARYAGFGPLVVGRVVALPALADLWNDRRLTRQAGRT